MPVHDTHSPNPLVVENSFRGAAREIAELPRYDEIKPLLPQPFWSGHESAMDCYWKAWELAFAHLRQPVKGSGFIANFIDTAFNDSLFMWDSAFILLFARYGSRAFNFQRTLDNLYAHQHLDGYICREIRESDGQEMFERHDPSSTGPNVLPWAEWEYFLHFGDRERLSQVFPCLLAYYQWFHINRSWPDGTYWSSGWGCGMDNQPRLPPGYHANFDHGHMAWVDTTLQQIYAARVLEKMAATLHRRGDVSVLTDEANRLTRLVNESMWDDTMASYVDRFRSGMLSNVQTIGAYWAMLAEVLPDNRRAKFLSHLSDTRKFNRPHRVPTLAADHPVYKADGNYWQGAIWAPANYMVLRGLNTLGEDALAHEIACNHHQNVVEVFSSTGTLWENYAPESASPGKPAHPDFVGWTGLPAIAVLLEYVYGLRADVPAGKLIWDVRLQEEHGVEQYPFGKNGLLNLRCATRKHPQDTPQIRATSNIPVNLEIIWTGGVLHQKIEGGS